MTLLIGWRCRDGIVLGSDTKEMRGGEASFGNKIFEKAGIVLAAEGLTGIRDDFLLLLDYEVRQMRGFTTLYELKVVVEDIVANLSSRYSERIDEPDPIAVLMGGLDELGSGKAKLYHVYGIGYGEAVDFRCSGSGGAYATSVAKFLYDPNLDVMEGAYRIAFVISWVSEDVDANVGGRPQVAIIRDGNPTLNYLNQTQIDDAIARASAVKKELAKHFGLEHRQLL